MAAHTLSEPRGSAAADERVRPYVRQLVELALLTGARFVKLCAFDVGVFQADSGTLFVHDSKSGKSRGTSSSTMKVWSCAGLS